MKTNRERERERRRASGAVRRGDAARRSRSSGVEVRAEVVAGHARAVVRQRYRNDETKPIEAVYTFPLPTRGVAHRLLDDRSNGPPARRRGPRARGGVPSLRRRDQRRPRRRAARAGAAERLHGERRQPPARRGDRHRDRVRRAGPRRRGRAPLDDPDAGRAALHARARLAAIAPPTAPPNPTDTRARRRPHLAADRRTSLRPRRSISSSTSAATSTSRARRTRRRRARRRARSAARASRSRSARSRSIATSSSPRSRRRPRRSRAARDRGRASRAGDGAGTFARDPRARSRGRAREARTCAQRRRLRPRSLGLDGRRVDRRGKDARCGCASASCARAIAST